MKCRRSIVSPCLNLNPAQTNGAGRLCSAPGRLSGDKARMITSSLGYINRCTAVFRGTAHCGLRLGVHVCGSRERKPCSMSREGVLISVRHLTASRQRAQSVKSNKYLHVSRQNQGSLQRPATCQVRGALGQNQHRTFYVIHFTVKTLTLRQS